MKTQIPSLRIATVVCASLLLLVGLAACASADYDVRGTWSYTLIAQDNNTFDAGTITFSGSPTQGDYQQVNIYQVTYSGEFRVSGTAITLTDNENWQGAFQDADNMSGTWTHENGQSGTWSAVRQSP